MSGCCCCCGGYRPPEEPPDGPPTERCTRYRVTFQSIDVSTIDDGFLGGDLETTWTFVVNGQVQTFVEEDLDTGVTPIGLTFFADVPTDTSVIDITVSGVEDDEFFDDPLPGFTRTFTQADNWGLGAQSGSGSDSNITYQMNYDIGCAQRTIASASRQALIAYGRERARTRREAEDPSNDVILLSWSIDRLKRGGWELVGPPGAELYTFEGYGAPFPLLVERRFAGGGQEEHRH
jgi:hypothetical protein